MYYKLYFGEDGIRIEQFPSSEILVKSIEDGNPGDFLSFEETKGKKVDMNGGYYPEGKFLIIKGEVIEPKAAKLTI